VAITDGVTDVVGKGRERFGRERLRALLADLAGSNPGEIRERLAGALDRFQVGPQADDTALVVMQLNAERRPTEQAANDARPAAASARSGQSDRDDAYETGPV
jgi:hypothetical protein